MSAARRYATGDGVQQNRKEAIKLFERAAALGHPNAMHNLGMLDFGFFSQL